MKNLSGQESLWVALPILIVVILLIAGLIFLPQAQNDIRSKASGHPKAIITPDKFPIKSVPPEVVCSDLYSPVCGVNGITYPNPCEANLAGVVSYTKGSCTRGGTSTQPQNYQYNLPTTN